MDLPRFNEIIYPILKILSDKKINSSKEIIKKLSLSLNLTDEQKNYQLSNGKYLFVSRYYWARFYLKKATLVETHERKSMKITKTGLLFLKNCSTLNDDEISLEVSKLIKTIKNQ